MKRFNRTYNDIQACPLPPFSSLCTHNILSMRMRIKHSQSQRGKKEQKRRVKTLCKKETVKWQHLYVIIITFYRVYSRPYIHIGYYTTPLVVIVDSLSLVQYYKHFLKLFYVQLICFIRTYLYGTKKAQNIACMQVSDGKWKIFVFPLFCTFFLPFC